MTHGTKRAWLGGCRCPACREKHRQDCARLSRTARLNQEAAEMRERNLNSGSGCKSVQRAIAGRVEGVCSGGSAAEAV